MRNSKTNKKHKLGSILIKIIIFTICITSLLGAGLSEATKASSETEGSVLLQQINNLRNDNATLKQQNETLADAIKKNETIYNTKLANSKIPSSKIPKSKIAYLTFDDGPSSNTTAILSVLKKYSVKATFFVNGHSSLLDLYKAISDGGHALANHTYSHDYKYVYTSVDNFKKDVKKLDVFLTETTGVEPNYVLRYPGGSNNHVSRSYGGVQVMDSIIKEMNSQGYIYFDWNVDSSDASVSRQSKDKIVQAVLSQSSKLDRPIILMHDLDPKNTTPEALPEIIEGLISKGFKFDVLSKDVPAPQFKVVK